MDVVGNAPVELGDFGAGHGGVADEARRRRAPRQPLSATSWLALAVAAVLAGGVASVAGHATDQPLPDLSPATVLAGVAPALARQPRLTVTTTTTEIPDHQPDVEPVGSVETDVVDHATCHLTTDATETGQQEVLGIGSKGYLRAVGDLTWIEEDSFSCPAFGTEDDAVSADGSGTDVLAPLSGLTGVADLGRARIGGTLTRHLRGTKPIGDDADGFGAASASMDDGSAGYAASPATVDVYVDAQGRPRRIVEVSDLAADPDSIYADSGSTAYRSTTDFTGYGRSHRFTAPPAADVKQGDS